MMAVSALYGLSPHTRNTLSMSLVLHLHTVKRPLMPFIEGLMGLI
jgi:hypothetical protein